MADVTVKYKGNTIAEMSDEGTKTLRTSGKYCEGDISVIYTPGQEPSTTADVTGSLDQSNNVLLEGNLENGTYTFKYKKNDGTYDTIGTYVLENIENTPYTNLAEPNETNTTDFTIWCNQSRMGSDASYRQNAGTITTNYIPVTTDDVIRIKGLVIDTSSTSMNNGSIAMWMRDPRGTTGDAPQGGFAGVAHFSNVVANGWFTISGSSQEGYTLVNKRDSSILFFRITAPLTGSAMDVIITRNEEIT